ncbi:hypothetical protein FIV34_11230 [Luteibacter pinisoli]|uniref:Uncharacterized protein n=1 Tax=Luteibacter pinisoli TaxID=2589080 RepID=A0A4Y5Z485_9GAMM|nr:hypothetical protein [Luteibacter pinisoli]QDE39736.1 hypothetical protein FIV34_11230 [Luteibacter pinisoli]
MLLRQWIAVAIMMAWVLPAISNAAGREPITIRTETYPRPPYSGATYYVYERGGAVICTKLAVCNKYDECQTSYHAGVFKDPEDVETGKPYGGSPAVTIPDGKLRKHQCLAKFVPDVL